MRVLRFANYSIGYIFVLHSQLAEQHNLSFGIGPNFQHSTLHSENTKYFITNKGTSGQRNTHAIRLLDEFSLGQALQNIREAKKSKSEKSQTENWSQTEKSQTEKSQNEKSKTQKSKTDKSQTEKSQTEKSKTEKPRTEKWWNYGHACKKGLVFIDVDITSKSMCKCCCYLAEGLWTEGQLASWTELETWGGLYATWQPVPEI